MTPSWYDVLDVEPTATEAEIRAAWKGAVADLEPTDRRFKRCNAAAEVLLDPERRAAHDAALAAEADADEDAEAEEADLAGVAAALEPEPEPRSEERGAGRLAGATAMLRARRTRETGEESDAVVGDDARPAGRGRLWLLPVVLGVLALALVVATVVAVTRGSDGRPLPDDADVAAARTAAEAAVVPILSFDYRRLDEDQAAAGQFMTDSYRDQYDRLFGAAVADNAPRVEAVTTTQLLESGIVRTGPGQVDVLTFVNRNSRNAQTVRITRDQVVLRMVDQDDRWLVDCLVTTPGGTCGDESTGGS